MKTARIPIALARGWAVLAGAFLFVSAVASARTGGAAADVWLLDLRFLPAWLAATAGGVAGALLVAWGLAPNASTRRRGATTLACVALALAALANVASFYFAWSDGMMRPWSPVPLSLLVAFAFGALALRVRRADPVDDSARDRIAAGIAFVVLAALFPLAQVVFFGTTDYARPADAAVVLGAKVHEGGLLSTSLRDRVDTAVELRRAGRVRVLIMSGGVGESGIDEADAMRDAAIASGVPTDAVLLDHYGVNTDATVRNTTPLLEREGLEDALVVSQFYHLPRIKLAYRAAGRDVRTVPARASIPITQTPFYVVREIPGFWVYWVRAAARDIAAGEGPVGAR